MPLSAAATWRSPDLGESRILATAHGPLAVHTAGAGRPIVFVHGWLANANLWRNVVARLSRDHRCISLDMPLGAHTQAMNPSADLSPAGCGRLIAEALDLLDLRDAVLVGNDSGGAYSQIAAATDARRIGGLVLNACETPYDPFPPKPFAPLQKAAQANALRTLLQPLKEHASRMNERAFGKLVKRPLDRDVFDSYCLPLLEDDGILADAHKAWASASQDAVAAASKALLAGFDRPVVFAWAAEDNFFSLENARRFAGELRNGRVEMIADSFSFTPEDQPGPLAASISQLAARAVAA